MNRTAAAPHQAPAPEQAAVPVEGSHADQGDGSGRQGPELSQRGQQGPRDDRPDARHAPQEVLLGAPGGARPDGLIQIRVQARNQALEPPDVCLECLVHHLGRSAKPVPLGWEHPCELPAAASAPTRGISSGGSGGGRLRK